MLVGDIVKVKPRTFGKYCDTDKNEPMEGTVCYIHPKNRYYTVEFKLKNGYKIREAFNFQAKKIPEQDIKRINGMASSSYWYN